MRFFRRLGAVWRYLTKQEKTLRDFAIGMSSEVDIKKDLHILFLDYDGVSLDEVHESILECQKFWDLSDCFIYETNNGFHAYFYYDIMPYSRVLQVIHYAKYVDDMFRFIGRYYDYKTIRVAGKYKNSDLKFVMCVRGARKPTLKELEWGNMKRKEREILLGMHNMLKKEGLKDGPG